MATASMPKATALTDLNKTSANIVNPRPTTKLVSLPLWIRTVLTTESPAIHQNHRAALRTPGAAAAISFLLGVKVV